MRNWRCWIIIRWFWPAPGQAVSFAASLNVVTQTKGKVEIAMGEITVDAGSENLTGTVQFMDASGNPTTPDEVPTWTSSDEAVATVAANEDGLTAAVTPGSAGAAIIEVLAVETDDDGNQTEVVARGTVNVVDRDETPDAVVGEVTFS